MAYSLYTECEEDFIADYETIARRVIESSLARFAPPADVQLSLYIVNENEIRELNRSQRGIDKVTDVLSFPNLPFSPDNAGNFSAIEIDAAGNTDPESGELLLGEIVICAQKMYAQAVEYGHGPEREFAFLVAHSILHLLGYDHASAAQETIMFALQEEILKEAGYER